MLENHGLDPRIVAADAGLPMEALYNETLYVDSLTYIKLFHEATVRTGNRFFSLLLAEQQGWDVLQLHWQRMAEARTLFEAFAVIQDYLECHTQVISAFNVEEEGGFYHCYDIRWSLVEDFSPTFEDVFLLEYGLAVTCKEIRDLLGQDWRPRYAQFMHKAPPDTAPLEKVFGSSVYFNQDRNAIFLTHEECNTPIPEDWPLRQKCLKNAQQEYKAEIPVAVRVDRAIRHLISQGRCQIEDVAAYFDTPVRTLQHQLKKEGSSYQKLLDAIRLELATLYLEHSSLSVTAIAERLHFAETSVFSRFIKAKTQRPPSDWR